MTETGKTHGGMMGSLILLVSLKGHTHTHTLQSVQHLNPQAHEQLGRMKKTESKRMNRWYDNDMNLAKNERGKNRDQCFSPVGCWWEAVSWMIERWVVEGGRKARVHLNRGEIGASKEKLRTGAKNSQWVTGSNKTCDLSIARRERKQQSLMGFLPPQTQSRITITYKAHTDTAHQTVTNTSISWQCSANKDNWTERPISANAETEKEVFC